MYKPSMICPFCKRSFVRYTYVDKDEQRWCCPLCGYDNNARANLYFNTNRSSANANNYTASMTLDDLFYGEGK